MLYFEILRFKDNSNSDKKIATLATKAVLKANLNKIVRF